MERVKWHSENSPISYYTEREREREIALYVQKSETLKTVLTYRCDGFFGQAAEDILVQSAPIAERANGYDLEHFTPSILFFFKHKTPTT